MASLPSASEYPMDSGYSWLVLISSFLIAFIILGQVLNFGIYYVIFLDHFGSTRKATSLPGALCYAFMCSIGPISSVLQKRFGARLVITIGAMLATAGMALSYLATELWHLYLTYGCMCGVGYGLALTPSLSILPEYFEKYKYFVTSFSAIGASLGSFVFAPFSLFLIEQYTWRGSMLVQAGLSFQVVVFGFICKSRHSYRSASFSSLFAFSLLKRPRFVLLFLDGIVLGGTSFTVYSMMNSFMIGRGLSTWQSAQLMSIAGLSNMVARIAAAIISPVKWTDRVLFYSLSSLVGSAGIIGCVFCGDFWSFAVAAVVFGFSMGIKFSQPPNVIIDLFGADEVVNGLGYFMFAVGLGGFVLPLLAGWLADQTNTENAFILTGINCLIGFCFCCLLLLVRRRKARGEMAIAIDAISD